MNFASLYLSRLVSPMCIATLLTLVPGCTVEKNLTTDGSTEATSPDDTGATTSAGETGHTTSAGETGPTTSAGTDDGPAVPGCEPQHDSTDDCCCFVAGEDGLEEPTNVCPATELCPIAKIKYTGTGQFEENWSGDIEPLDCILTALRDGAPGKVSWSFFGADTMVKGFDSRFIRADRSVFVVSSYLFEDLNFNLDDTTRQSLKPADFFTECLDAQDIKTKALCLAEATDEQVDALCLMAY